MFLKKCIIGFSYGVSFPLTIVLLDYWLKECGMSNTTIGLFSLFHLPFTLKLFFAPIIDECEIPYLSKLLGKQYSWVIVGQFLLIISILCMAQVDPKLNLGLFMFFASMVALADGIQNIALYPYQISDITQEQFGYTAGTISFGHRIGTIATKVFTLYCAHFFGWKTAYECSTLLIFFCMISIFFMKEPKIIDTIHNIDKENLHKLSSPINKISEEIKKIFYTKNGFYTILILLLYRATDFTIQKMSRVFCLEIGFSKVDIANIVQFFGSAAVIVGGFLAGFIIKKYKTLKAMIILSIIHMIFLFSYLFLNYVGNNINVLCIVIFLEGISGGAVAAAFISFLYEECKNGSQYALLWAIHELGGICFRFYSGFLVDQLGWNLFFIITPLLSLPCIIILMKRI